MLLAPKLAGNLLSISKVIRDSKCTIHFTNNGCVFHDFESRRTIGNAREEVGLYLMDSTTTNKRALC